MATAAAVATCAISSALKQPTSLASAYTIMGPPGLHTVLYLIVVLEVCFGMFHVTSGSRVPAGANLDAAKRYWERAIPGTQLPENLQALVSPLRSSSVAAYLKYVAMPGGAVMPASCKAAGILCQDGVHDDDIYQHQWPQWIPTSKAMRGTVEFESTPGGKSTGVRKHSDFFRESQLVLGSRLPLGHERDATPDRAFLPLALARSLAPFITNQRFPELLRKLGIANDSTLADHMATTVAGCNLPPMKGETRKCMTSIEELVDFVSSFTTAQQLQLLTVTPAPLTTNSKLEESHTLVPATVTQVTQLTSSTENSVVCHSEMFSSALYTCHASANKHVYSVTLQADMDSSASRKLVAVCHQDTSEWTPLHVAFYDLGVKPGETEACHWIHERDVVFLALSQYSSI